MRRYRFLNDKQVYESLNKVRDAFLAAKDGNQVNDIIDGLLTHDEKMKIGRRIIIAEYLSSGFGIDEISRDLKVGKNTIMHISRRLEKYKAWFELIKNRNTRTEKEYQSKKHKLVGSSTLVLKKKKYAGFKRKDVRRG